MTAVFDHTGAAVLLPGIFLAVAAMVFLMVGVFRSRSGELIEILSVLALAAAAALVILAPAGTRQAFAGAFIVDDFARVMKVLALFGSAVAIILSVNFMKSVELRRFEYPILVMLATVGMMMMISANDLIALYIGFELQSLALYVTAAIDRDSARSSEAGLKYFVLGALSSGMLLYGASLIYGFTGATGFPQIAAALGGAHASLGL